MKIACIIVTFNRKQLLKNCLEAVNAQNFKPTVVYITDNASTDGTMESVQEWGYYNTTRNGICYKYILNSKNEGGAGGFNLGMKTAYEEGESDAYWVMDDDGVPASDCLEKLICHMNKYDYLSPMVIDTVDANMTSFMGVTVDELLKRQKDGIIENECNPFNGVIYSHKLVKEVGFPKKEMFIWGDEINYNIRARQAGYMPAMVVNAIHRHPINRQQLDTYLGKRTCVISDSEMKLFCMMRNKIYNMRIEYAFRNAFQKTLKEWVIYNIYYLFKCKDIKKALLVNEAIIKGFTKNFNGLNKYIK